MREKGKQEGFSDERPSGTPAPHLQGKRRAGRAVMDVDARLIGESFWMIAGRSMPKKFGPARVAMVVMAVMAATHPTALATDFPSAAGGSFGRNERRGADGGRRTDRRLPAADDEPSVAEKLIVTGKVLVPPIIIITAVLGSIMIGFATPTEAAAAGAVGSLTAFVAKLDYVLIPVFVASVALVIFALVRRRGARLAHRTFTPFNTFRLFTSHRSPANIRQSRASSTEIQMCTTQLPRWRPTRRSE
jgi:TRAP-type mannitol/chloroaromatic compound transport system permease large subunit